MMPLRKVREDGSDCDSDSDCRASSRIAEEILRATFNPHLTVGFSAGEFNLAVRTYRSSLVREAARARQMDECHSARG